MDSTLPIDQLQHAGYVLLGRVYSTAETASLADRLSVALQADEPSVLRSRGQTYGSRDLIRLLPEVREIPQCAILKDFIAAILGPRAGLVRALYFDKPPDRSWSLTWHKDMTIAVKSTDRPSSHFRRPTFKTGIPHVEAPESLLANMLTLRLHLDAMTAENGPLSVIPGSHLVDEEAVGEGVEIHANAGDVLAMRPLLTHSSRQSQAGTMMHRRIIHLEFAPSAELPDGYEWHSFYPVA
jgi:ectoine hydroxylase-related dioxygenase (phytanoyl-CoA dioxygenase family)